MRKALTMLGAIAALAVGSLFAATAQAQTPPNAGNYGGINCTYITSATSSVYPYSASAGAGSSYAIDCTGDVTRRNAFFNMVSSEPNQPGVATAHVKDRLNAAGVRLYFFNNYQEYRLWFDAAYDAQNGTTDGWTGLVVNQLDPAGSVTSPNFGESHVVVFKVALNPNIFPNPTPGNLPVTETKTVSQIAHTAAHEIGHQMDLSWSNLYSGQRYTTTNEWLENWSRDRFLIDYTYQLGDPPTVPFVVVGYRAPCGAGGVFNGAWDYTRGTLDPVTGLRSGQTVCNGSSLRSDYKNGSKNKLNTEILAMIYPRFFDVDPTAQRELMAEMYSVISGNRMNNVTFQRAETQLDTFIANDFGCGKGYMQYLRTQDAVPAPTIPSLCTKPLPPQPWPQP